MVKILIADDHEVVRRGLRQLLEQHEAWQVCGEASDGREAVELAKGLSPDVVVLDLAMPKLNGLEATRQIIKARPATEILILTLHETESLAHDALEAGARGFLLKADAAREIVAAVEALSDHKPYFTRKIANMMLERYLKGGRHAAEPSAGVRQLTAREREIIQLLAEGHGNKAVSSLLGISVKTVETHRATIMKKLGINSITELVKYAIRNAIIQP